MPFSFALNILKTRIFPILLLATMLSICIYLIGRISLFLIMDYAWYEKVLALGLLVAEIFIMIHGFGYFLNVYRVLGGKKKPRLDYAHPPELKEFPEVAIVVSSFKEPLSVVEDTLVCFYNLTYPNKRIYFLDDTRYDQTGWTEEENTEYRKNIDALCARIGVDLFRRTWRGAKAGMINDFLAFLDGSPPEGFAFTSNSIPGRPGGEKYIIVFDADMNPLPNFVQPLLAWMEAYPDLAFIQTPQYYINYEHNRVAKAAGLQQAVFYEYICEGKSEQDAMFCCGTNVIFRRQALRDVGGFDESSVTEDFATSLKFHAHGWHSAYVNKVLAFGLGPEDLGGYFKQQFRWSLGTVGLLRSILSHMLRNPRLLPPAKWWEYFLSGTHYFVGWVMLILFLCPMLYLLLGVPTYFARPELYFMLYFPYVVLSLTIFAWTLSQRHYRPRELITGIVLQAVCFPVYMWASLMAVIGIRGSFKVTPKGQNAYLPLIQLWPQVTMAFLCFASLVWGLLRLYYEHQPVYALSVNSLWCLYHFSILSAVLYFNHPEQSPE
ncbi:MAG: glycosyltransferase family 2 protein [Desulfovermiculus sp.]